MSVEPRFSWPTRIYWEDTDAGGVVYHARYVAFMERARTEWMRALGYGQERMRAEHGMVFAVRSMQMDFTRPARLDDSLVVSARVASHGRASIEFEQDIRYAHDDSMVLATAAARVGCVDMARFRPRAIPDSILKEIKE